MPTPILPQNPTPDTFGAPFQNVEPTIDPQTDLDANFFNLLIAQVCGASFTAPRALAQISVTGTVASLGAHGAVWGDASAVAPTVSRSSAGVYTVAWAATYNDLQVPTAESHAFAIRAAKAFANTTPPLLASATWSGSVASVQLVNASGAATDGSFTVEVW